MATKLDRTKAKKAKTKASKAEEWWQFEPAIPKREPARATHTLKGGGDAKRFADVLKKVVDVTSRDDSRPVLQCIQMQTAKGLRLVSADGYRLAVAEYMPGLRGANNKTSSILARSAMFHRDKVLAIAKVIGDTSPMGRATLEVKRVGLIRTLYATNDKGSSALATEHNGSFPDWLKLVPTEKAAEPAAMNAKFLQWVALFCKAITCEGDGIVRIRHLGGTTPARFDASSGIYRGLAVVMPMYVEGI